LGGTGVGLPPAAVPHKLEKCCMKGDDSLEQMIREENTLQSLPVVTIGNKERLDEQGYRERCASRLVEILFDIENYMGVGRVYIP
jgi:hypothetical protein